MTNDKKTDLVGGGRRDPPSSPQGRNESGSNGIRAAMVSRLLARSRDAQVARPRQTIGRYEFRDPDYRQILLWANALNLHAETVVQRLEGFLGENAYFEPFVPRNREGLPAFVVNDGAIEILVWDYSVLPLTRFEWVEGLSILEFGIVNLQGRNLPAITLNIPSLRHLYCPLLGLQKMDLTKTPLLQILNCSGNNLTELDLSHVPGLTNLDCSDNQLTEVDLSHVPGLTVLSCLDNRLTELDLSLVPGLTHLSCGQNQLTELNLSHLPGLIFLNCDGSELTELDLSHVPGLTELNCSDNRLTELDLSLVPGLIELSCSDNRLTELDLSHVPELKSLNCSDNQLTELDLSCSPRLTHVYCVGNRLTELDETHFPGMIEVLDCDPDVNVKCEKFEF